MKTERAAATGGCCWAPTRSATWRPSERAALEAHLEGCAECRAEAERAGRGGAAAAAGRPGALRPAGAAALAELGERIAAAIGGERRAATQRRRRRRFGFGVSGAAVAAAAALLAIVVLPGGGGDAGPEQHVEFGSCRAGSKIYATLEPHAYGTEIHMYVKGVRSGTLCRVFLRDAARRTAPRPAPSATAGATTPTRC